MALPRVSFGMIVLNGEPFIRYNLRSIYPFAHEIIVVEGAVKSAAGIATSDGHSTDTTLDTLYDFKKNEDPDDKLIIITQDGFWAEKDKMSQAYAQCATGDYLWQIDADEFYKADDITAILQMLEDDPDITAVSFEMLAFWGAPFCLVDSWQSQRGAKIFHRLFKWEDGYRYVTHRPPTVHTAGGENTRHLKWINGKMLARQNIFMYHYSYLFPKQVQEKCQYYSQATWNTRSTGMMWWYKNCYLKLLHPFKVHIVYTSPSWLEQFKGQHPQYFLQLWQDIQDNRAEISVRDTDDIHKLLASPTYKAGRFFIKNLDYILRPVTFLKRVFRKIQNGFS